MTLSRLKSGTVIFLCLAGIAAAQSTEQSAQSVTLDVSTGLSASDNPDLQANGRSDLRGETDVTLGITRRTGVASFTLRTGTGFDISTRDGDTDFADPFLDLTYGRDVGHSNITFTLNLQSQDLEDTTGSTFGIDDSNFNEIDSGTRITRRLGVTGATGVDGPLELQYSASQRQLRYEDTIDPGLRDADLTQLGLTLLARPDPQISVALATTYSEDDQFGAGATDTTSFTFGPEVIYQISETIELSAGLAYARTERSGATNDEQDGLNYTLGLSAERPRGTWTLNLASTVSELGRRNSINASHSLALPSGSLSYSFGLSRTEGLSTAPLYGLSYTHDLPRGSFNIAFDQAVTIDQNDNEDLNSRLSMGYTQDLTASSQLSANLSYNLSNDRSPADLDTERLDLSLTYTQALAQDWNLVGTVSTARLRETNVADRDRNSVFVGLRKTFEWR